MILFAIVPLIVLFMIFAAKAPTNGRGRNALDAPGSGCRACGIEHPPFANYCRRCGGRL
jgi:hypothetical protein